MKFVRLIVAGAFAFAFGDAYAFHSGGVAECEGCHSMHNSFEGAANIPSLPQFQSGKYLLKASDQSSACLNCHNSADTAPTGYHVSTDGSLVGGGLQGPIEMTPGGDFAWLKMTMTGVIRKNPVTWEGDRHGHNIIANDFSYTQDKLLTAAPGGSYPAANLHCSSCHDPHGRYRRDAAGGIATTGLPIFNSGSYTNSNAPIANVSAVGAYRLLAGNLYQPKSLTGSFAFTADPPAAVSPSSYNGANTTIAGTFDRVAYGSGMSEWCGNCHASMHNDTYTSGQTGANTVHPAGGGAKLTSAVVTNYTSYISSGRSGTPPDNGYSALAPFESGNGQTLADYTAMKAFVAAPAAPTTASNVLCLSCHRAHASAFESMARYYLGNEFMTVADASYGGAYDAAADNKINTGYSQAQQQNAYNGRPATLFGPYARDYCNKCHVKD